MTRVFTDGAEMGDTKFWDWVQTLTVASSTRARGGTYSYNLYGNPCMIKWITPLSELYFRFARYSTQNSMGSTAVFIFRYEATNIFQLIGNAGSNNKFQAYVGSTGVSSGSTTILQNTWYLLELYLKIADENGRIVLKIDGTIDIDYTGDTKPDTNTTVNNIYFNEVTGGTSVFVDDLALNNTNDGVDDSWCGDGYVIKLTPSGSSATTNNWLNSGSVSGSANYLYVDEYPKDDNTTYVYASASSTGLQTQFALSNPSLPAGAGITRIYAEGRVRKFSGNEYGLKLGELAAGGTDVVSGSRVLMMGDFGRVVGNQSTINPVSGSAWTTADLNDLELVLEI